MSIYTAFRRFPRYNPKKAPNIYRLMHAALDPKYAPNIYRLIDVMLIGKFLMIPSNVKI